MITPSIIGAAIGGFTQLNSDNPIGIGIGAGIGYYVGSGLNINSMVKPYSKTVQRINVGTGTVKEDYKYKFSSRIDNMVNREIILNDRYEDKLAKYNAIIDKHGAGSDIADEYYEAVIRAQEKRNKIRTKIANGLNSVNEIHNAKFGSYLFGSSDAIDAKIASVKAMMGGLTVEADQRMMMTAYGVSGGLATPDKLPEVKPSGMKAQIIHAGVKREVAEASIRGFLVDQLGHRPANAEMIAKSMAAGLEGMKYTLGNTLRVEHEGRTFSFPMEHQAANGLRYVKRGERAMPMSGFNPFADALIRGHNAPEFLRHRAPGGIPTVADATRRLSGMEMLAFLKGWDPTNKAAGLEKISRDMWSLVHFASNLDQNMDDPLAHNIASRTKFTMTYAYDPKTETGRLQQLETKSIKGELSDYDKFMQKLSASGNMYKSNIPVNDKDSISTVRAITPALFPSAERGANTVTMRDYIVNDYNKELIKDLTGLDYNAHMMSLSGLGNAQTASVLGIDDEIADLIPHLFGNDAYTLDDGSGLFTGRMEAERMYSLDFTNYGTEAEPKYLMSSELTAAMDGKGGLIKSGVNLGIDDLGAPIRLGDQFDHATFVDSMISNGKLRIRLRAQYSPKDWVKIFSANAKAGLAGIGYREFKRIEAIQELKDRGAFGDMSKMSKDQIHSHVWEVMNRSFGEDDSRFKVPSDIADWLSPKVVMRRSEMGFNMINEAYGRIAAGQEANPLGALQDAMYKQLITDNKANQSATVSLLLGLKDKGLNDELAQMHQYIQKGYGGIVKEGIQDQFHTNLKEYIGKVFTDVNDFRTMQSLMSIETGASIRGAGNEGSMSWLEKLNLRYSGWTDEDISHVAKWNPEALMELDMIEAQSRFGQEITNQNKLANANTLSGIYGERATNRAAILRAAGFQIADNAAYISYSLTLPHKGYRSVPIPLRETNVSRTLDLGDKELLSSIEKQRRAVVLADLEVARLMDKQGTNEFSEAKRRVQIEIERLGSLNKKLASGDNNIVKNAIRMSVPGSEIQTAVPLGGTFGEYASKIKRPIAAFNNQTIRKLAEAQGIDPDTLIYRLNKKANSPAFTQVFYKQGDKELPLRFWSTREPAQGPGSTLIYNVYHHKELPANGAWIGLPQLTSKRKNAQQLFAFADYDADTFKTASFGSMPPERIQQLIEAQSKSLADMDLLADLANRMALKNANKDSVTLANFTEPGQFENYLSRAAHKAAQRKILSASTTDMATKMAESLNLHLESLRGSMSPEDFAKRQFSSRLVIHNLVENLIKTQHLATEKFGQDAMSVQKLDAAFANIDNNPNGFRATANAIMDEMLGGRLNDESDAAKLYRQSKADVIDGLINNHRAVVARQGSLEENRKAIQRGIEDFGRSIRGLAENGLLPGIEDEGFNADINNIARNGKNIMHYVKNTVSDNKRIMFGGALALGVTAAVFGADSPELSKDALPLKTSDAILPPLPDEKGYITKGRDYRSGKSITVKGSSTRSDHKRMVQKSLFSEQPAVNVHVSDKRSGQNLNDLRFS